MSKIELVYALQRLGVLGGQTTDYVRYMSYDYLKKLYKQAKGE